MPAGVPPAPNRLSISIVDRDNVKSNLRLIPVCRRDSISNLAPFALSFEPAGSSVHAENFPANINKGCYDLRVSRQ